MLLNQTNSSFEKVSKSFEILQKLLNSHKMFQILQIHTKNMASYRLHIDIEPQIAQMKPRTQFKSEKHAPAFYSQIASGQFWASLSRHKTQDVNFTQNQANDIIWKCFQI